MVSVLGLSCFFHDSAAVITIDGKISAAAQEERFTRIKHDSSFPTNAIRYCLEETALLPDEIDHVIFYDNPFNKYQRLSENIVSSPFHSMKRWLSSFDNYNNENFVLKKVLKEEFGFDREIIYSEHHMSHAASAFFPSPFRKSAIITIDGVGEWSTATYGIGEDNKIKLLAELHYPHSVGLLYSAFTFYCGFKVNSGEYKLMGLAPYGKPIYVAKIKENIVNIHDDGSINLNMDYFDFVAGQLMINKKFVDFFGRPKRKSESPLSQYYMDIAKSIQVIIEEIVMKISFHVKEETGCSNLCLAGGVALNCVANGKLLANGPFDKIWIQPAAGDAGGALGSALAYTYLGLSLNRRISENSDSQNGSYLGPSFSDKEVQCFLDERDIPYEKVAKEDRAEIVAKYLSEGKIIGHFSGRMEYGPRALGSRSIIGDARDHSIQRTMNLKIKYRESFRPFAPSVLEEDIQSFFELDVPSPYMLLVAKVNKSRRKVVKFEKNLIDRVNQIRSDVPSITHIDYSARVQSVGKDNNKNYYDIIKAFKKLTGYGVIVNTSFNVRGEPIVCTPLDAYICFMRTEMDILVLEDYIILKKNQPEIQNSKEWMKEYELD